LIYLITTNKKAASRRLCSGWRPDHPVYLPPETGSISEPIYIFSFKFFLCHKIPNKKAAPRRLSFRWRPDHPL